MLMAKPSPGWRCVAVVFLWLSTVSTWPASSTVNEADKFSWSPNTGWINWRPDSQHGAVFGEFVCSGFLYCANTGWISLGNGMPANQIQYSNASANDFGINHDGLGNLRGLAYGANIGWIVFEETGAPRVDLATGEMRGAVYGANIGWVVLEGAQFRLRMDALEPGLDSDGDGIPDAWELFWAGDLSSLSREGDYDGDGVSDYEEYLADTNPMDPEDQFRILAYESSENSSLLSWTSKPTRVYQAQSSSTLEAGEWRGLGLQFPQGEITTMEIEHGAREGALFFRLQAFPPLSR
jgi:hypothetical protein